MPTDTTITTTVPTYQDEKGHTSPHVKVEIEINQGIAIKLPRCGSDDSVDVYIERQDGVWKINVSPDSDEIEVVVAVKDNGDYTVVDDFAMRHVPD